jgi:GNAT superfamily N-acetyltransferase
MVRALTVSDLPEAALLGPQFFAEGGLPGRFVPDVFSAKWGSLIEQGIGFILGLFRDGRIAGAFGGVVVEDLNSGDLVASECFWFVTPESRGRGFELLLAYEAEARKRGAVRCSMIHLLSLQPEKLGELYERRGYKAVETSYFKELN